MPTSIIVDSLQVTNLANITGHTPTGVGATPSGTPWTQDSGGSATLLGTGTGARFGGSGGVASLVYANVTPVGADQDVSYDLLVNTKNSDFAGARLRWTVATGSSYAALIQLNVGFQLYEYVNNSTASLRVSTNPSFNAGETLRVRTTAITSGSNCVLTTYIYMVSGTQAGKWWNGTSWVASETSACSFTDTSPITSTGRVGFQYFSGSAGSAGTGGEFKAINASAEAAAPVTPDAAVIVVGNSIAVGFGAGVGGGTSRYPGPNPIVAGQDESPPCQMMDATGSAIAVESYARSSGQLAFASDTTDTGFSVNADYPTTVRPRVAYYVALPVTTVVMLIGEPGNMLYYSDNGGASIVTEAITAVRALCALAQGDGAKFVACTLPPRSGASPSNPNLTTDINSYNTQIKANWRTWGFDGIVLLDKDARLQNTSDSTYFADTTHPNAAGSTVYANYMAQAAYEAINPGGTAAGTTRYIYIE